MIAPTTQPSFGGQSLTYCKEHAVGGLPQLETAWEYILVHSVDEMPRRAPRECISLPVGPARSAAYGAVEVWFFSKHVGDEDFLKLARRGGKDRFAKKEALGKISDRSMCSVPPGICETSEKENSYAEQKHGVDATKGVSAAL